VNAAIRAALAHVCGAMIVAAAQAEEPSIPRIGVVAAQVAYEQGLRDGLHKLGYVEGKNIVIDWRRSVNLLPLSITLLRPPLDPARGLCPSSRG
jgi:hypothetical protein